jgi:hypothetical protein
MRASINQHNRCDLRPTNLVGLARSFVLLFLCLLGIPTSTHAQWGRLFTLPLPTEEESVIYFLDLPGPPRVGFIGDFYLFKTTDGGLTWRKIPNVIEVTDFAFKDSLTGWCSSWQGCYKTTDGGESWNLCPGLGTGAVGIYYNKKTDGLFLSSDDGITDGVTGGWNPSSWDEGDTWVSSGVNVHSEEYGGFAFADDDTGLLAWFDYPSDGSWYRTTDGGHTWNIIGFHSSCYQPLAIPGTQTYFAFDALGETFSDSLGGRVFRTDDAGESWNAIYTFPPQYRLYNGTDIVTTSGCIRGTFDSLYVMLCSGCYLSTDQGISWKYLCGQPDSILPVQRFYVKNNRVYVFSVDSKSHCTLWMLDLDSLNTFAMHFSFVDATKQKAVQAGDTVSVYYRPETDTLIGIDSAHFVVRFDSDALGLRDYTLPPGWKVLSSHENAGSLDLWLIGDTTVALPNPVLRVAFNTYLSAGDNHPLPPPWKGGGSSAFVYLDSAHLYGKRLNCDCQALSVANPDSVEIDFTGCGDSTLARFMQTGSPFTIESIVPNPARSSLRVEGKGQGVTCEFEDELGRSILPSTLYALPFTLDVKSIPSGVYYLRLSQGGFVQTRRIIIQK